MRSSSTRQAALTPGCQVKRQLLVNSLAASLMGEALGEIHGFDRLAEVIVGVRSVIVGDQRE